MKTPPKKLKILFIIDNYYPFIGGAEILAQKLAEGLVNKGHQITVITSAINNAESHEILNGVEIHRIRGSRYSLPFKAFFKAFKKSQYCQLIHTSTYSMLPLAWLVSVFRGLPRSVVVHELLKKIWYLDMSKSSAFFHFNAERFMIRFFKFTRYIAVSEFTRKQLQSKKIPDHKINMIYNGIDQLPEFSKTNFENIELFLEAPYKLIYAGRPGTSKGVMPLLESVKILKEKSCSVHLLLLLGEDPKAGYLNVINYIKQNQLEDVVTVISQVPYKEFKSYLNLADAFVLPSLQEGFGILGGQLSLLNKPIIAAKNGALPEVLSGKIIWVPSINATNLARGIEDSMAGSFLEIPSKSFKWETSINEYEALFQETIGES